MQLEAGRVKGMVEDSKRKQGVIVCHDTLDLRENAVCRGFYDAYKDDIQLLQLAERMDFIEEVNLTDV